MQTLRISADKKRTWTLTFSEYSDSRDSRDPGKRELVYQSSQPGTIDGFAKYWPCKYTPIHHNSRQQAQYQNEATGAILCFDSDAQRWKCEQYSRGEWASPFMNLAPVVASIQSKDWKRQKTEDKRLEKTVDYDYTLHFKVADTVECRNGTEAWKPGVVASIDPFEVKVAEIESECLRKLERFCQPF